MSLPVLIGGRPARKLVAPGFLSPAMTFTRASSATALGADGVTLSEVGINVPRFQGAAQRLLIEGQRTNQLTFSAEHDHANWVKSGAAVTADQATGLDGALTADFMLPNGSSAVHRVVQGITAASNVTYVYSVCAKVAPGGYPCLAIALAAGATNATFNTANRAYARFNVSTGVVEVAGSAQGTSVVVGAGMVPMADGWYRCWLAATPDNTGAATAIAANLTAIPSGVAPNPAWISDNTSGIYVWGSQLELGNTPTSIMPTTAAAATRSADMISASLSSLGIGDNAACTALWSGVIPQFDSATSQYIAQIDAGSSANRWVVFLNAGTTGVRFFRTTASVNANVVAGSITAGVPFSVGMSIDGAGNASASLGGGTPVLLTGGPVSGLTTLRLGNASNGALPLNGETARFSILPYALPDAALQAAVAAF